MTRFLKRPLFLSVLILLAAFFSPVRAADELPSISQADVVRLVMDWGQLGAVRWQKESKIIGEQLKTEIEKATRQNAGNPQAQQQALKAVTEKYQSRMDAVNRGGQDSQDFAEATHPLLNPSNPEAGFVRNWLDSCIDGHKVLTRNDTGEPVIEEVTPSAAGVQVQTFVAGPPQPGTVTSVKASVESTCRSFLRNINKSVAH